MRIVANLRRAYELTDRFTRLRETGLLTLQEMADLLAVSTSTVKHWHSAGLLRGTAFNDKGECLYERPGDDLPTKREGSKLSKRVNPHALSNRTEGVQYED